MNKQIHTISSLQYDLTNAGIQSGDVLLVHSSMKSLGEVDGGADSVFRALQNTVTEKGLLIFPSFSDKTVTEEHPDFDPETAEFSSEFESDIPLNDEEQGTNEDEQHS